jgi:DNA-3-methyladenine glycosylase II
VTAATVSLPAPLDVAGSLEGFRRWGDDGIDRWDGRRLLRTVRIDARPVPFRAVVAGPTEAPALSVETALAVAGQPLSEAIAATFLARLDVESALARLAAEDPAVGRVAAAYPGIRPVLHRDPFTALVRSISAQQINLGFAASVRARLAASFGHRHAIGAEVVHSLDPRPLAGADVAQLRALQFTNAKAAAIIATARAALEGELDRDTLARLDDAEVIARLVRLPGVGPWTAEWFLARTLGRPRVVGGDLGVRKAVGRAYFAGRLPSEDDTRRATAHWGAAAGVAQQLLLHDLVERSTDA